ncbi:MAG: hypothetical protein WBG92_20880 [Thiohalocapsa sp.]
MPTGNRIADFPPKTFDLFAFCESCGHSAVIKRALIPAEMSVGAIPQRLRCSRCDAREAVIRIVYTGAGGFHHSGERMLRTTDSTERCEVRPPLVV